MYKIVTENNHNEVWASGFWDEQKAKDHIHVLRNYMYDSDKSKTLIVISYTILNKRKPK